MSYKRESMKTIYTRNREELEAKACKWWPESLVKMEAKTSIIPLLLKTQDSFISILMLSTLNNPNSVFEILAASNISANLFLKHLMVLTDFGSEPLQRINENFSSYFLDRKIQYMIEGKQLEYSFTTLPITGSLTNKKMKTDVSSILTRQPIDGFYKDLIILLLFGSNAVDEKISEIFAKCNVGNMLGNSEELKQFIHQRYILVSRIIGGAQANGLGNAAQSYVEEYLRKKLGSEYTIKKNGHIPGITQNNRTETTFDITIERNKKYIGVEISFQVTTNSTIERKAGQAQARYLALEQAGYSIAYIIDGAGNFQRESALKTICQYSHCTVAYTDEELDILLKFIKEKIG